jgi:hypothetical protein
MRLIFPIIVPLTLIAAYVAGLSSRGSSDIDLSTVSSFERSLAERDPLNRSYGYTGFLPALGPGNIEEALEVFYAKRQWLSRRELRNFMVAWSRFDPRGALDWTLSQSGRFKEDATAAAIWAWAFEDSVAARQALNSLSKIDATESIRDEFILGWLWGGDPGAAEYIAALRDGMPRQKAVSALTIALMRKGPESVIEWADAIPDDAPRNYKSVAFQKAGIILAYVDPQLASRWITGHLDRRYSTRAMSVIGSQWVEQDAEAALAWLVDLPAGKAVDNAMRSSFGTWLKRDSDAAFSWLRSVSPAAGADPAIQIVVRRESGTDPESALEWAQRTHDPTAREELLVSLGQNWFRTDPKATREWLSESGLSDETQTAIQNPPKRKKVRERSSR